MKKYFIYLSAALFTVSCNKLDTLPVSSKTVEGYYKNEAQLNEAILAEYNGLRTTLVTSNASYMLTESHSDNCFQGQAYNDGPISRFEVTPELPVLYDAWVQYYSFINRCNRVLQEMQLVELDAAKARQYEGESKFIRALFYFDLVRLFGGVPLVTTPLTLEESYLVGRSTTEAVYDQVIKDLQDAADLLPAQYDNAQKGRATKWAAKAFLGKVLLFESGYPLHKNKWDAARQLFKEVIDSGVFSFFTKYEDIYSYSFEGGSQQVFSILFKSGAGGNGNPFPTRNASNDIAPVSAVQGGLPFGGSALNLFLSNDLINSYEQDDLRKDVSVLSSWLHKSGDIITTLPTCKKYQNGPVADKLDWDIDWIVLSYTDVLMMYAECLNEMGYVADGEAFEILNDVRQRAGLAAKTGLDIPDQNAFRLWMEEERRHEFAFENMRWFDLVRTDRALEVMKAFLTEYGLADNLKSRDQYLFPIPQTVRNITPQIEQNPGYN